MEPIAEDLALQTKVGISGTTENAKKSLVLGRLLKGGKANGWPFSYKSDDFCWLGSCP